MNIIDNINRKESELLERESDYRIFCGKLGRVAMEDYTESLMRQDRQMGHAIIRLRQEIRGLKLDAGNYPVHQDIPSAFGNEQ